MFLIVGLGNPGREYLDTRHNVGFEAVDVLAAEKGISIKKIKHQAITGEGTIAGEKVILAKPQTYMNNSGISVRELMNFYKLTPDKLIVIYDEAALPTGKVRIKPSGSDGGHNGMKSIIYQLGSQDIARVRFGIGEASGDLVNHVLGKFTKEETAMMIEAVKNMPEIISLIVGGNISEAMNRFNRSVSEG
ncbi:MAG: aminoacyl-tRNA hydrolase [Bacillota bacterium]|nr:aminoacyl-tRNA hydrolase [Bacillota bacterium]